MQVRIIEEHGFKSAMLGLGLSFGKTSDAKTARGEVLTALHARAKKLCSMDKGHNKFLRQIQLWIDIDAPLYWWKQFDQYKVATVTQSESTMHTLMRNQLKQEDFEGGIEPYFMADLNWHIEQKDFAWVNRHLPVSFLQRRICTVSYATLRAIVEQRKGHKLPEWNIFIETCISTCMNPEFLEDVCC